MASEIPSPIKLHGGFSTMTDMTDLKRVVQRSLRENVHGVEFDLLKQTIDLYDMLGVDRTEPRGTIMHPSHEFWDEYTNDISTERDAFNELKKAVELLRDDGSFVKQYPNGEEADIVYCEVEAVETGDDITVVCNECDAPATATMSFEPSSSSYRFILSVDCSYCDESSEHERVMNRR